MHINLHELTSKIQKKRARNGRTCLDCVVDHILTVVDDLHQAERLFGYLEIESLLHVARMLELDDFLVAIVGLLYMLAHDGQDFLQELLRIHKGAIR